MVFFNDSVFVCVFVFLDTLQLLASLFVLLSSPLLSFLDTLQLLADLFILHYFLRFMKHRKPHLQPAQLVAISAAAAFCHKPMHLQSPHLLEGIHASSSVLLTYPRAKALNLHAHSPFPIFGGWSLKKVSGAPGFATG